MPYVNKDGKIIGYTREQVMEYQLNLRFKALEERIKKLENDSKEKKK